VVARAERVALWLKAQVYDIDRIVEKVARVFEIAPQEIW